MRRWCVIKPLCNSTLMHIKVNVYANIVTLSPTHVAVCLYCAKWPVLQWVITCSLCDEVSQRSFPIADKPSTPLSQRQSDFWEKLGLTGAKRKTCMIGVVKKTKAPASCLSQESLRCQRRQELVYESESEKKKLKMQRHRRRRRGVAGTTWRGQSKLQVLILDS